MRIKFGRLPSLRVQTLKMPATIAGKIGEACVVFKVAAIIDVMAARVTTVLRLCPLLQGCKLMNSANSPISIQ